MPQLLIANGRRSGGRHLESAVSAAASGVNANKRGIAGLVFEKGEFRPTSLLHFFAASSSTLRIAAVARRWRIAESALFDAEDVR